MKSIRREDQARFQRLSFDDEALGSDDFPVTADRKNHDAGRYVPMEPDNMNDWDLRGLLLARRSRGQFFSGELFADPAWDMLLTSFLAVQENQRISVSDLCASSGVPESAALRWISKLETDGWLEREGDGCAEENWVRISEKGQKAMRDFLRSSVIQRGL